VFVPVTAAAKAGHGVAQDREVSRGIFGSGKAKILIMVAGVGSSLPVVILNPANTMARPARMSHEEAEIGITIG
jgi:hypothetical protein